MENLLDFYKIRIEDMLSLLESLVRHESPSTDKTLVDALSRHLHKVLEERGAQVTVHPREAVGDLLLAKWNAEAPGSPIMLMGHMDTVWPGGTLDHDVPVRRDENRFSGPGALDMKAGIVIALEAIRGLQDRGEMPERPIWMLLTSDEEIGSDNSRELILQLASSVALCLVMEPAAENEGLKTSRKGLAAYRITARGRAAHAGNAPEEGSNAIVELAHQAIALHALNQLRKGTSVSVTMIQGGTAENVIPAEASLYADARFFSADEARRVDETIRGLSPVLMGCTLEISGGITRHPMERTELMIKNFERAQKIAAEIGFSLGEAAVGGGSDGSLTAQAGVSTLDGLGAHGDGMHALHEHVLIRSLPRRAALVAGILRDWPI
jgi:glutamate carboxypeptidase